MLLAEMLFYILCLQPGVWAVLFVRSLLLLRFPAQWSPVPPSILKCKLYPLVETFLFPNNIELNLLGLTV